MKRLTATLAAAALAVAVAALSACGGGGGGAVGPAPTVAADSGLATTAGTITGFGSIFVDGVRLDNHGVLAGKDREDGSVVPAELKLGQHVEVQHDGNLVAASVRVVSEVEGSVSAVATATLTVMGQTVTVNTDPAAGPVTVFETPYTTLADVKVGDLVEVHGLLKSTAGGTPTIQATRIEPKDADAFNRVGGTVANLATTTFNLGALLIDYSGAKLLPPGVALANGQRVYVSIPAGTVTASTGTTTPTGTVTATLTPLKAAVVRVSDHRNDSHTHPSELGGAVSSTDAGSKTFTVSGVKVDASAAAFSQPGKSFADLKTGTYVMVRGIYDSTGMLKATAIVIRGMGDDEHGTGAELHGTILNFVSLADFTVRDVHVHVDAGAAKIDTSGCGAAQLANGMQVEVEGALTSAGHVKAASVKCESVQEGVSVVEAEGRAGKVDQAAQTLTLTTEKGSVSVHWTATTLFKGTAPASLDGQRLEVEGTLASGVLQATKIMQAGH